MINVMFADKELYKPSTDSENCCQSAFETQVKNKCRKL